MPAGRGRRMYEMRELVMSIKVLFQCRAAALLLGTAIAVAAAGVASAQAPVSAPAAPAASAPPSATPAAQPAAPAQAAPAPEASQPPSTPTIANASLPHDLSPWGMFLTADIVVKVVMVGLVFASLVTWTVWLAKNLELLKARRRARKAIAVLNEARTLAEANARLSQSNETVAQLLRTAIAEVQASPHPDPEALKERVSWLLERVEASASRRIGRGMGLLASIGAVAPFVGLFGTVWGIMNSFIGISNAHTTNLAVVAPGIAEALLATALGLFAAIPAVVIYNAFSRAIGGYRALLADGSALVMRLLSRDCERVSIPMSRAAE
jgi:biopolymer transport protein ExbB